MAVQNGSAVRKEVERGDIREIWRSEIQGMEVRNRQIQNRRVQSRQTQNGQIQNRQQQIREVQSRSLRQGDMSGRRTQGSEYCEGNTEKRNPYLAEGIQAHNSRGYSEKSRTKSYAPVRQRSGAVNDLGRAFAVADREAASRRNAAKRRARMRRRKRMMIQRLVLGVWAICLVILALSMAVRDNRASAAGNGNEPQGILPVSAGADDGQEVKHSAEKIQGLPADVYAKHPDWTENFLTPNEYSRPGDALETVTNIFVHYTANPGTSAAQNRSYFEQQKDTHENSVSSHFIIGYEGEILQCVPLDEIAYAVATRNFDSISIECCYLAQNGAFTEATYDSLVSLLAWLVDAYDLETSDILRHYDCGGKKCPLYYTENENEWEQLKKDVDKL